MEKVKIKADSDQRQDWQQCGLTIVIRLLFAAVALLLFLAPLYGVRISVPVLLVVILVQVVFWVGAFSEGMQGERTIFVKERKSITKKNALAAGILTCALFMVVSPLVSFFAPQLYESADKMEGYVVRTANRLSGSAAKPVTGGRINQGNQYRSGAVHLMLSSFDLPAEPLYLRGFSGGDYIGGDWMMADESHVFEEIGKRLGGSWWGSWVGDMYESMYFIINQNVGHEELPAVHRMTIRHFAQRFDNAYEPYYSLQERVWYLSYNGEDNGGGYTYLYYEQDDMNIDWEDVPLQFESQRDWYREIQDAYIEEVQEAYTRVPVERLPRLTQLVEENPLTELDEITSFILYTLHSNAVYSLTPGWAPLNEDIVEYFLFERGAGFCEHFAAAATLMYRLYGIPARYATGYQVDPDAFTRGEGGQWSYSVTDENAHAWVEIFIPEYGWTPVEVTPALDGSAHISYPGFDGDKYNRLSTINGWDVNKPSLETTGRGRSGDDGEGFRLWVQNLVEQHGNLLLIGLDLLLYALLLAPIALDRRRKRRMKEMEKMNSRQVFGKLLAMLHFADILTEYDGTERDFGEKLEERFPTVAPQELYDFLKRVERAAFGPEIQTDCADEAGLSIYGRVAADICEGLDGPKKWQFKYSFYLIIT